MTMTARIGWSLLIAWVLMFSGASVVMLLASGCAAKTKMRAVTKAELRAVTKGIDQTRQQVQAVASRAAAASERSVALGAGAKYSGGAGWVAGVAIALTCLSLLHWRSARDRDRLRGMCHANHR